MASSDDLDLPDRRKTDTLTNFRMDKMERELEKTNDTLIGLDNKLDTLRGDLFERSIFVNLNTMELELQKRDYKIISLENNLETMRQQRANDTNLKWVKIGTGVALFAAIASALIGIIAIIAKA
jgi:hypothetical protein